MYGTRVISSQHVVPRYAVCGTKKILGQYLFAAFGMLEDMYATRQHGIKKNGVKVRDFKNEPVYGGAVFEGIRHRA